MLKDLLLTFCLDVHGRFTQSIRLAGIDEGQKLSEQHGEYTGCDRFFNLSNMYDRFVVL